MRRLESAGVSLRDEDDALLLLPEVADLTTEEAEAIGCYWMSPEGIPEFESRPVNDRKPNVLAAVQKWVDDDVCSSYITVTMVREIDYFLSAICGDGGENGTDRLTLASEEYGRNMLKVLSYLLLTGEYPKDDSKLDWLFDVLSHVMQAASLRENGSAMVPLRLDTVGDVRRLVGVVTFAADVFDVFDFDDNPHVLMDDDLGMRILNPVIAEYVAEHPESAHVLASFVMDRGIGDDAASGDYVIEWYETGTSPLKSGAL